MKGRRVADLFADGCHHLPRLKSPQPVRPPRQAVRTVVNARDDCDLRTLAPLARLQARANPIRPDERLEMKRTGSIAFASWRRRPVIKNSFHCLRSSLFFRLGPRFRLIRNSQTKPQGLSRTNLVPARLSRPGPIVPQGHFIPSSGSMIVEPPPL